MVLAVPRKLIVVGDSGVYGWGDPEEGGWCERLRRHWMALPQGPVLYGLGVRGDGLERVRARLPQEVSGRGELRRQLPQGILLAVGLNDCARIGRVDGRHQMAPEAFLFGLQDLLTQARQLAPTLVLGLTPVLEEAMPFAEVLWYQNEAIRRYEALLEEACLEADVPFLPLLESIVSEPGWQDWLCDDGLHLNADGHAHVAARLRRWPALLRWAGLELLHQPTGSR
ncbi:MAG: GDSL-type esterase/lipase family protein [Cyanobium sp.]